MKKTYIALIAILSLAFFSCNDEWNDEQYIKMVAFAKSGVNTVYIKYDQVGGIKNYKLPIIVTGSLVNDQDVLVTVGMDEDADPTKDTLTILNFENFRYREDLYYRRLDDAMFDIPSMEVLIPKGSDKGYLNIDFSVDDLDMSEKYILPLKIVSSSVYFPITRRFYKKSLMNIKLFNDFSGNYSTVAELKYSGGSMVIGGRNTWVVDEKTIFFYAGNTEEESIDRIKRRVYCEFNQTSEDLVLGTTEGTVRMYTDADGADMNLVQTVGTYTTVKSKDTESPQMMKVTTTMTLKYTYIDKTSPSFNITFTYDGNMVRQRSYNTLIPEDLQQDFYTE